VSRRACTDCRKSLTSSSSAGIPSRESIASCTRAYDRRPAWSRTIKKSTNSAASTNSFVARSQESSRMRSWLRGSAKAKAGDIPQCRRCPNGSMQAPPHAARQVTKRARWRVASALGMAAAELITTRATRGIRHARPSPSLHSSLTRSPRRPRNTNTWPLKGCSARTVCTFAASESMPQRMSVTPAASQTRVPARGPIMCCGAARAAGCADCPRPQGQAGATYPSGQGILTPED
jgi:hypothetical protein